MTGGAQKTYQLAYYRPWQASDDQPVKTETVTGLDLSSILVKGDEWREWTGGTMTYADITAANQPVAVPYVDKAGVAHQVEVTVAWHDYWTAAGELLASCLCGWRDHHTYLPGGRDYADMKLRFRAIDHVS